MKYDVRYQGFREEMEKQGGVVYSYHHEIHDDMSEDIASLITQMYYDHEDAQGVFAESFMLSVDIYRTFASLGIDIPNEIKVIGYGNAEYRRVAIHK